MLYYVIIFLVIIVKMRYLFLIILLIIIVFLFIKISNNKKKYIVIENIKTFIFRGSTDTMRYSNYLYSITKKDNKYIASIKLKNQPDTKEVEVTIEEIHELENILNKHNISSWNGFDKFNNNIMDGSDFSLTITLTTREEINASGYMKYPKNFSEVREDLDNFFLKLNNK